LQARYVTGGQAACKVGGWLCSGAAPQRKPAIEVREQPDIAAQSVCGQRARGEGATAICAYGPMFGPAEGGFITPTRQRARAAFRLISNVCRVSVALRSGDKIGEAGEYLKQRRRLKLRVNERATFTRKV
jgi:hypothetical protein